MNEVVITAGVRTAQGKFAGALKNYEATQLGGFVIKEVITRAGIKPNQINEVIMGNVVSAGQGQNVARQAMIAAGLPYEIGAFHVEKVCGSSLKAIVLATQAIKVGDAEAIVAGGMESMTNCPYLLDRARFGYRMFDGKIIDSMVRDGLWDKYNTFHMGMTGEVVADMYDITRKDCDTFAYHSHQKAAKATEEGKFKPEIMALEIPQKKADPLTFTTDEGIRKNTTVEKLGTLKAVFKENGVVTAGNASQITDGASAVLVTSKSFAEKHKLPIKATIRAYNTAGVKPAEVMAAPIPGVKALLKKEKLTMEDIDLVEHNEAFSSASLAVMKALNIPEKIFNVHGGAVAIGHPIGSSGSRILITLMSAMEQYNKSRGLATICLGGGNAVSMIIER